MTTAGFLLDTSILSVFAPGKPPVATSAEHWMRANDQSLLVPIIAVLEIERGIAKLKRSGGTSRADALVQWLEQIIVGYGERILPIDTTVAREAGRLEDEAAKMGRHPGLADVLIAATARIHDLIVLTANTRHFELLPIKVINPLADPLGT